MILQLIYSSSQQYFFMAQSEIMLPCHVETTKHESVNVASVAQTSARVSDYFLQLQHIQIPPIVGMTISRLGVGQMFVY